MAIGVAALHLLCFIIAVLCTVGRIYLRVMAEPPDLVVVTMYTGVLRNPIRRCLWLLRTFSIAIAMSQGKKHPRFTALVALFFVLLIFINPYD